MTLVNGSGYGYRHQPRVATELITDVGVLLLSCSTGAAALSRSSLIAGENALPSGQHRPAPGRAASALPAIRPPADPADPPVPKDRDPEPAAA